MSACMQLLAAPTCGRGCGCGYRAGAPGSCSGFCCACAPGCGTCCGCGGQGCGRRGCGGRGCDSADRRRRCEAASAKGSGPAAAGCVGGAQSPADTRSRYRAPPGHAPACCGKRRMEFTRSAPLTPPPPPWRHCDPVQVLRAIKSRRWGARRVPSNTVPRLLSSGKCALPAQSRAFYLVLQPSSSFDTYLSQVPDAAHALADQFRFVPLFIASTPLLEGKAFYS